MVYLALIRYLINVALRKESVDRNNAVQVVIVVVNVALRKESVDRNRKLLYPGATRKMSLSARRAWIEIGLSGVDTVSY